MSRLLYSTGSASAAPRSVLQSADVRLDFRGAGALCFATRARLLCCVRTSDLPCHLLCFSPLITGDILSGQVSFYLSIWERTHCFLSPPVIAHNRTHDRYRGCCVPSSNIQEKLGVHASRPPHIPDNIAQSLCMNTTTYQTVRRKSRKALSPRVLQVRS